MGGNCDRMFDLSMKWRIPLNTCQTYRSKNPTKFACESHEVCSSEFYNDVDETVKKTWTEYSGLNVKSYKTLESLNINEIKKELLNGPIVVYMEVIDSFMNYGPKEGETDF